MQPATRSLALYGTKIEKKNSELRLNFLKTVSEKCNQIKKLFVEYHTIFQDKVVISCSFILFELIIDINSAL